MHPQPQNKSKEITYFVLTTTEDRTLVFPETAIAKGVHPDLDPSVYQNQITTALILSQELYNFKFTKSKGGIQI